jgi:GT2 family glycosyltransferase
MEVGVRQSRDGDGSAAVLPSVTVVILSWNRRDELRTNLRKTLFESEYDPELVDVVVVDNASEDGSAEMVREEFPQVRLIERDVNCGVSGINDGFAVAEGDLVLGLDDDCYLGPDGLTRAVAALREHNADLVSFGVSTPFDVSYRFDQRYLTGLLTYWGCAVLMRREVVERLGGYDPGIFVWANELEFMLRFFDAGYRHLHMPEVIAMHMKEVVRDGNWRESIGNRPYLLNAAHWSYIAGKRLRARDALEAFIALIVVSLRDAVRVKRDALKAIPRAVGGFARGLSARDPVRSARLSRTYRRNFHSFASPWWMSRPPSQFLPRPGRASGSPPSGRKEKYFAERARYYPTSAATLDFRGES